MSKQDHDLQSAVGDLRKYSANELAGLLKKYGITGRPCTTGNCPIAKLMKTMYGPKFIVGQKFIAIYSGNRVMEKIPTPSNIAQFVKGFDMSRYPDLIEPPPRAFGKRDRTRKTNKKRGKVVNHPAQEVGR